MEAFVVRAIHLVAMAVLLGGAVSVWAALDLRPDLELARRYETAFWAGAGAIVLTGVGNLGALAPAVPGVGTVRGTALAVKLGVVLSLLAISLGRTVLLARTDADDARAVAVLRRGYAVTAVVLLVVVGLAGVVARG